jgi:hypothetical protein
MTGKARYLEADRAQLSWDSVDLSTYLKLGGPGVNVFGP